MAKRYYLTDIIGDGTEENPFRPAVADLGVSWVGSIPTGDDGRPLKSWALVMVAAQNHALVRTKPGVDALPDFPLDGKLNSINQSARQGLDQALTKRGLSPTIYNGADGYRDVIRAVGRANDPAFDENNFDVAE